METLRNYLESMFKRYPETSESERAKAELWQMMEDKYNELLADGKKENEAVGIVISEFGDLEEVAESLGIATMLQKVEQPAQSAQAPAGQAAAAAAPVLEFGTPAPEPEAVTLDVDGEGLAQAAAARSAFADEALRESFGVGNEETAQTQQTVQGETADGRGGAWWSWHNNTADVSEEVDEGLWRFLTAVQSVFWPTVTCLYLCWSFLTFKWWLTWIIWPLAAVLHSILKRLVLGDVTASKGRVYKSRLLAAVLDTYWPCVVFVYFLVSFLTGLWWISWLIFVIAPFVRKYLEKMSMEVTEG